MIQVTVRNFLHNFSHYLKLVKEGNCFTILERKKPVADIIPHNPNIHYPGWRRVIKKRSIAGEAFSETVVRCRK